MMGLNLQMQATQEQTRALSEELVLESKARETAEEAHEKAANRAAEVAQKLAEQIGATKKIEARLADAENKLQLAKRSPIKSRLARRRKSSFTMPKLGCGL
jgi:hypothetical protein